MLRLVMITVMTVICSVANAAKSERVYFVRSAEDPVTISSKSKEGQGIKMRDPNLGGDTAKKVTAKAPEPIKKAAALKITPKKSALAFKPMKIGAALRMPRIEFGRVALPTGIREEQPSTDFIGRSLSDMP